MSGGSENLGRLGPDSDAAGDSALLKRDDGEVVDQAAVPKSLPDAPIGGDHTYAEPADEFASLEGEGNFRRHWVLPTIALVVVAIWLGAMLWLSRDVLGTTMAPVALVEFIAALCVPPALIGIVWLLALRSSAAEARRFGATSRAMRAEAASLERTIAVLAHQLDANRAQLAEQTNTLMAMGDGAAQQLGTIRTEMAEEVAAADAQTRALTAAVTTAQSNLGVLLASLPRAHAETGDMAKTLEITGLSASEHAAALDAQLSALAERGREADTVAGGAAQKLAAHITRMEATSETAGARLEQVTGEMSSAVDALLGRTASAVDEARKGIAAQGEAMLAMLEANQSALDRASRDSVEALGGRITAIEMVIDRIAARLDEQRRSSDAIVTAIDHNIVNIETRIESMHSRGIERTQTLAASISALGGSADAMTEALKTGDDTAKTVIRTAEDLLTSLDAAAREIDETLPGALTRLDERIAESKGVVAGAKPELLALVTAAESTHDAIEAIAQVVQGQRQTLDQLSGMLLETLNTGRDKAAALGGMVDETIGRTQEFAETAAPRLIEALIRVRDTASAAADRARETLATVIPEAARSLEDASAKAMKRAAEGTVERQVAAIAHAGEQAVEAATRASERLSVQMTTISETTGMIEARIDEAREERETADSNSLSRRVSLLIESLNSASIDITKTFSHEVSDSAWAAYLKGDRGVFTRRAVRLLDGTEAREIARLYDEDADFREQLNRYIHDFESMLRAILSQREGSTLGVTLISSDMGKLYVALAQAIERLRT